MLPSSVFTAGILLSLVPGYLFLRLSEGNRRPRTHSAISELLEVAAVGLLTTGVPALVVALAAPTWASSLAHPAESPRKAAGLVLVVLVAALVIAWGLALAWNSRGEQKTHFYVENTWVATLGIDRPDHITHVALKLHDGATVDGPLYAFTYLTGEDRREVVLQAPVHYCMAGGNRVRLQLDYMIWREEQIKSIGVQINPNQPKPANG